MASRVCVCDGILAARVRLPRAGLSSKRRDRGPGGRVSVAMLRRIITLLRSVANRTLRLPLSHAQGGRAMIPIDLSGQVALVTGVGDNEGFAWFISKALKVAGAKVVLACHPRVVGIVEGFLTRNQDAESRKLPDGSELTVEK